MAGNYNTAAIYRPKTLSDVTTEMEKHPDAVLLSGGMGILSQSGFYPAFASTDFISLSDVKELQKVFHGDRFFEVGAGLTISQLLSAGSYIFPSEIQNALSSIGNSILRNNATIGGSLFSKDTRTELSCILATIGASCEIRSIIRNKRKTQKTKINMKWIAVEDLYRDDGSLAYEGDTIVTRIRIPVTTERFHAFRTLGSVKSGKKTSVVMGLAYNVSSNSIVDPKLCLVFPSGGFVCDAKFDSLISSSTLPIPMKVIVRIGQSLVSELLETCPGLTDLQTERAKRLIETTLYQLNTDYFAN